MAWRLTIRFQDNSGKVGVMRPYLAESATLGGLLILAENIRSAVAPLSNAAIVGGELELEIPVAVFTQASALSDSRTNLVAFFKDELGVETLRIPSPSALTPYETAGAYLGVRVTRESAAQTGYLAQIEALAPLIRRPDGSPFPPLFDVAGKDWT